MRAYLTRAVLIAFAALSIVVSAYYAKGLLETQLKHKESQFRIEAAQKIVRNLPVRLKIPSINVDADVEYVSLTDEGAMEVPRNTSSAGWFNLGPSPGERGSAVIAGHFNGKNGEDGVFKDLGKLKEGDEITVTNDKGETVSFAVREIRTYRPGYAEEVFSPNDNGTHLNLITCDGVWDEAKKSYSKRLVVFADITNL